MKALLYGVALCVLAAGPAEAAKVRWQGVWQIIEQTGECPSGNYVGFSGVARFEPPVVPDNGPGSKLSLFFRNYAETYRVEENFTDRFQRVEAGAIGGTFVQYPDVRVKFESVKPANVTADSVFVQVVGKIKGFEGQTDCVTTFRMNASLR
jgi:hypothetical protein